MRTFPAEYVSKDGSIFYFNVDLGFKKWHIARISPAAPIPTLKFGDRVTLNVLMTKARPAEYEALITKL